MDESTQRYLGEPPELEIARLHAELDALRAERNRMREALARISERFEQGRYYESPADEVAEGMVREAREALGR
jgi:hypothetical protein